MKNENKFYDLNDVKEFLKNPKSKKLNKDIKKTLELENSYYCQHSIRIRYAIYYKSYLFKNCKCL